MRHDHPLLVLPALLAILSGSVYGNDFFVNNKTGNDSASGSTEHDAFLTLAKAAPLLAAGDRLVIANTGTPYNETLSLRKNGAPGKPIIIEGNGSVLSGLGKLDKDKWQPKSDGVFFYGLPKAAHLNRFVFGPGLHRYPAAAKADSLGENSYFCDNTGLYFRPAAGKTPADYDLCTMLRGEGVSINNAGYIVCRNLVCEYFANDGFNAHGHCSGLVFENIVGRHNGDDGFSIHEDIGAYVSGGHFHGNQYGIQNIQTSRAIFHGVLVENNRDIGIHQIGGYHSVEDSVVRNNARAQFVVAPTPDKKFGADPFRAASVFLKNVRIEGGPLGLRLDAGVTARITHCELRGASIGLAVAERVDCLMTDSIISGCSDALANIASGDFRAAGNLYAGAKFVRRGITFSASNAAAYAASFAEDASSVFLGDDARGPGNRPRKKAGVMRTFEP